MWLRNDDTWRLNSPSLLAHWVTLDIVVAELNVKTQEEMEKMPSNMRASLQLRLENYDVKDIAQTLNLADQTVNNLLSEAKKRLKKDLPKRFEHYNNIHALTFIFFVYQLLINS